MQERVVNLLATVQSEAGLTGQDDLARLWLQEALTQIMAKPWSWLRRVEARLTYEPVSEPTTTTYTWTQGNNYVESSAALTLPASSITGRWVSIDGYWYRVVDYGFKSATRIYFDSPIYGSNAAAAIGPFYRFDYGFRAKLITSVFMSKGKMPRLDPREVSTWISQDINRATNGPAYYDDNGPQRPPAPKYAPVVATVPGAIGAGTYHYYFTRVDKESGIESRPGPVLKYQSAGGVQHNVTYGFTGNVSEDTSFYLRLYRSKKNPNTSFAPMFFVAERPPTATTINDNNVTLETDQHYQDDWVAVNLRFGQTQDVRRLTVTFYEIYGFRADDDENISLGKNNEVLELIRLYFSMMRQVTNGDPQLIRGAKITFTQQMEYLLSKDKNAADGDSPSKYVPDHRDIQKTTGQAILEAGTGYDWYFYGLK